MTTTLDKIRRLAERRRTLWGKTSPLTAGNRAEIARLTQDLDALWERHRDELVARRLGRDRGGLNSGVVSALARPASSRRSASGVEPAHARKAA